jgi:hypothetical protein
LKAHSQRRIRHEQELPMNWNTGIRQFHRWTSMVFTATVIANFAAMTRGQPPAWITYSPLLPLFALLFSGLYMFALPHVQKWRSGTHTDGQHAVTP